MNESTHSEGQAGFVPTLPEIRDPLWVKPDHYGPFERFGLSLLRDERDLIFLKTIVFMVVTIFPAVIGLFASEASLVWKLAVPYLAAVFLLFGGRYGLMLHATGHRPIFKREYAWMQHFITFVLGPLLGHTPTSFEAHHMWMHHAENNMEGDGSCTLAYKRDSFPHWFHYWARFFFFGHIHLTRYLVLRGRARMARRFWAGEAAWLCIAVCAWLINPAAATVVFIIPLLIMRVMLMAGNFAQHAFVDIDDPDNGYKNSNNLVNADYNHIAYNDGYHIVHHIYPGMHWSEMPLHFTEHLQEYIDADAVVFDGIADNIVMWVLIMTRRYDYLAEHLIDLKGRTHEEKVAFLKERMHRRTGDLPPLFHWETPEDVARTDRHLHLPLEQVLNAEG